MLFDVFGDEVEVDFEPLAAVSPMCALSEGTAAGSAGGAVAPAPLQSTHLEATNLRSWPGAAPHPSGLPVAPPKASTGGAGASSRRFLVADVESFYRSYVAAAPQHRHCYEIIREDTPCRLFFDLEYRRGRCQVKPKARGRQAVAGTGVAAAGDPSVPYASSPVSAGDAAWVELNRGVNGDVLVAYLLFRVARALRRDFGVSLSARDVVHLESSTAGKFSRHLTLHCWREGDTGGLHGSGGLAGSACAAASTAGAACAAGAGVGATSQPSRVPCLFRSVEHAGRWVRRLVAELQAEREAGARAAGGDGAGEQGEGEACEPLVEALWVQTADECQAAPACASSPSEGGASSGGLQLQRSPFVDLGVYTRNRAMRMMLSSKRGKTAPLMPALCNRFGIRDDMGPASVSEFLLPAAESGLHMSTGIGTVTATSAGKGSPCSVQLRHGAEPGPDEFTYWLRATQPVGQAGATGAVAAPSPYDPLVQTGPATWERGLWEASLITGTIPPLSVLTIIANLPNAAVLSAAGAAGVPSRSSTPGSAAGTPQVGDKRPRPADDRPTSATDQKERFAPCVACVEAAAVAATEAQVSRSAAAPVAPFRCEYCPALGAELLHCSEQPVASVAARPSEVLLPQAETKSASATTVTEASRWRRPAYLGSSRLMTSAETRGRPVPFTPLLDFIRCCAAGPAELALARWAEALRASGSASAAALDAAAAGIGVRSWSAVVVDISPPAAAMLCTDNQGLAAVAAPTQVIQRLYLELTGSRWCNNVGRQHASNGIKWTVELASGAAWQTCWDQGSCAGYRSTPVRIPLELLPDQLPATSPANGSSGVR